MASQREQRATNGDTKRGKEASRVRKAGLSPSARKGLVVLFPLFVLLGYGPTLFRHLLAHTTPSPSFCDPRTLEPLLTQNTPVPPVSDAPPVRDRSAETPFRKRRNINTATALDLTEVTYVGKVLSQRIVAYREQLGGYYHLNQLREVKGLSRRAIRNIGKRYAVVKRSCCRKMPINQMSQESLSAHPYFSPDNARYVMTYLQTHGLLTNEDDLLKALRGDRALLSRVKAYISYE